MLPFWSTDPPLFLFLVIDSIYEFDTEGRRTLYSMNVSPLTVPLALLIGQCNDYFVQITLEFERTFVKL